MSKNVNTIAVSVPVEVSVDLDVLAKDLHVSRSALVTALISQGLKWYKEGLNNAIQRREEGESYTELCARNIHTGRRKEFDK
jgi:post-segregation antitoxin (ccd killing protein)